MELKRINEQRYLIQYCTLSLRCNLSISAFLSVLYHQTDLIRRVVLQVVGDDLLMSNPKRIERARLESTCNALVLKVSC